MNKKIRAAALLSLAFMLSACESIPEQIPPQGTASELPDITASEQNDTPLPEEAPEAVDPDSRYIYYQLSEDEKKLYDCLKSAAESFSEKVVFPFDVPQDTARKIFAAVYNQEPQIFWLDSIFYPPNGNIQILRYRCSPQEAAQMQQEIDRAAADILSLTEGMTDYDRVTFFHDYIVRSCTFNMDYEYSSSIYGALCGGYAQCEGYAFAMKYLCSLADICCITVTGFNASGDTHAWNIVRINDIWYNIDLTWDDPILETENPDFLRHYYCLVPDSDILNKSHFRNEEYFTYPSCYDGSRNYYAANDLMADSSSDGIKKLTIAAENALKEGHYDAAVRFRSRSDYLAAQTALFDLGEIKKVVNTAAANAGMSGKVTAINSLRYRHDELFIIHISIAHS